MQKLEKTNAEQSKILQALTGWAKKFQKTNEEYSKVVEQRELARQKSEKETSSKVRSLEHAKKDHNQFEEGIGEVIENIYEDFGARLKVLEQGTCRPTALKPSPSPVKTRASV